MKIKARQATSRTFENANEPIPDLTNDIRAFLAKLPDRPREAYLKSQVWSKFVSNETDPPELRKSRAIEKWLRVELKNADTNERLALTDPEFQILRDVSYSQFMAFLTSLIETTIGAVPPDIVLLGGFSGGASTSRSRDISAPAEKFTGQAHVTARARELAHAVMCDMAPTWANYVPPDGYLVGHESNTMFTVPKNTTIDRVACKEPDVNMFLQKGVGNYIRSSLRRAGVNLNDQSINQRLALHGARTGELATLDLSSASDSVTRELVFQLVPIVWFTLLDSIRSEVTVIGGEEHVNEMFSSMGNGFTFELESLVFWAIARTVCYFRGISGSVSVYGDDIIVPVAAAEDLVWVLSYFGFEVNPDKSFWEGPFRESCGGHYHYGMDISPFYIRRPVDSLVEAILLANNIRCWSALDGMSVLDDTLFPLWEYVVSHIPECYWGGTDLGSTSRVVTYAEPSNPMRLSPLSEKDDTGLGGYLHWLSVGWKQDEKQPDCTGHTSNLKLVSNPRDPSLLVLQWTKDRRYGYTVSERELETSYLTDTSTKVYRCKRARKRSDIAQVIPFWGPGDTWV